MSAVTLRFYTHRKNSGVGDRFIPNRSTTDFEHSMHSMLATRCERIVGLFPKKILSDEALIIPCKLRFLGTNPKRALKSSPLLSSGDGLDESLTAGEVERKRLLEENLNLNNTGDTR